MLRYGTGGKKEGPARCGKPRRPSQAGDLRINSLTLRAVRLTGDGTGKRRNRLQCSIGAGTHLPHDRQRTDAELRTRLQSAWATVGTLLPSRVYCTWRANRTVGQAFPPGRIQFSGNRQSGNPRLSPIVPKLTILFVIPSVLACTSGGGVRPTGRTAAALLAYYSFLRSH